MVTTLCHDVNYSQRFSALSLLLAMINYIYCIFISLVRIYKQRKKEGDYTAALDSHGSVKVGGSRVGEKPSLSHSKHCLQVQKPFVFPSFLSLLQMHQARSMAVTVQS